MTINNLKNYYFSLAVKGDGKAAFEVAKILYNDNANPVLIQTQLRRAAENGCTLANQWLGLLGIKGKLLKEESTTESHIFHKDGSVAIAWLEAGAEDGDNVCKYILAKCYQLGIAVSQDVEKGDKMLNSIDYDSISEECIFSIMFILDSVKYNSIELDTVKEKETVYKLLAG